MQRQHRLLARTRLHCGSLRRANFASPARQAYFAYWRAKRPFDVVTTKPPGFHLASLSRQPSMGDRENRRRRSGYVRFALNAVSYRLGWSRILQAVGCLTCQVNHRQPLSLLALSHPFLHATSIRLRRISRTSSISAAISTKRVLIRAILCCNRQVSFPEAQSRNDAKRRRGKMGSGWGRQGCELREREKGREE